MSVPIFHEMLLPILRFAGDDQNHKATDALEYVKAQFPLSEQDTAERLANGRTKVMDRVLWAMTYLRKVGLIESVSWGVFRISGRGRELLNDKPKKLSLKDLERYPEYLEFKGLGPKLPGVAQSTPAPSHEEHLLKMDSHRLFRLLRSQLRAGRQLLDAFQNCFSNLFRKDSFELC